MPNKKSTRNNKKKTKTMPQKVLEPAATLYFYNGTTFPKLIKTDSEEYIMKNAKLMIKAGLKAKVSIETQIQDYRDQLIMIEKLLYQHCNPYTKNGMDIIERTLNDDVDSIMIVWMLDICALLHLGVIKNDNQNGILKVRGDAVDVMF